MKITDRFKRKETAYRYVDAGTVFKCENEYYMATEEIIDSYEDIYNCVKLDNGEILFFDGSILVEVLEAEMFVK